jgi:hypothetical protein
MPHYKDGSTAKVGDLVKGKPYSMQHEVVGEIVSIAPRRKTRNCQVAFVHRLQPDAPTFYGGPSTYSKVVALRIATGELIFLGLGVDYGQAEAFEKIG